MQFYCDGARTEFSESKVSERNVVTMITVMMQGIYVVLVMLVQK